MGQLQIGAGQGSACRSLGAHNLPNAGNVFLDYATSTRDSLRIFIAQLGKEQCLGHLPIAHDTLRGDFQNFCCLLDAKSFEESANWPTLHGTRWKPGIAPGLYAPMGQGDQAPALFHCSIVPTMTARTSWWSILRHKHVWTASAPTPILTNSAAGPDYQR